MIRSNCSKYSEPFSSISFIMSPYLIKILCWFKLFFFRLSIDRFTALWSMSIISAKKETPLSVKYFERASPMTPLPQPSSKNLKVLPWFLISYTLRTNLGSSFNITIICSVSNLGIRIGDLSTNLRSKNCHSLHMYWTG